MPKGEPEAKQRTATLELIRFWLSHGWFAPHELRDVVMQKELGYQDAITSRIRDLRKLQYGGFIVKKRWAGTYFEYSIGGK